MNNLTDILINKYSLDDVSCSIFKEYAYTNNLGPMVVGDTIYCLSEPERASRVSLKCRELFKTDNHGDELILLNGVRHVKMDNFLCSEVGMVYMDIANHPKTHALLCKLKLIAQLFSGTSMDILNKNTVNSVINGSNNQLQWQEYLIKKIVGMQDQINALQKKLETV